jgi:hypothetical protein
VLQNLYQNELLVSSTSHLSLLGIICFSVREYKPEQSH